MAPELTGRHRSCQETAPESRVLTLPQGANPMLPPWNTGFSSGRCELARISSAPSGCSTVPSFREPIKILLAVLPPQLLKPEALFLG